MLKRISPVAWALARESKLLERGRERTAIRNLKTCNTSILVDVVDKEWQAELKKQFLLHGQLEQWPAYLAPQ